MLKVLNGQSERIPPVWFMRQAGRYLPEYREIRADIGSFMDLCYTPDLACEVTMQPIRRFGFDAAILFSDILVIPDALGQKVSFVPGKGPVLGELDVNALSLDKLHETLAPVYQTVKQIQAQLTAENFDDVTLIGFAGAPFTVATYMIEGGSSKDFMQFKKYLYGQNADFQRLIDLLTEATISYLRKQIDAGAEVIQLFESWAGAVGEGAFRDFVIKPNQKIRMALKESHPHIPVIGFPKGASLYLKEFAAETKIDALGCDFTLPLDFIHSELQPLLPVQGNLDPGILYAGGDKLDHQVKIILETLSGRPFIFNLGHGIHKDTPIAHVEQTLSIIREF